jgi:rhodanese-related sulfurtransferase
MPLTVLNVAFPLAPVGPDAVGGAEKVAWQLDRALVEGGHRSLVVAMEGSEVSGSLFATPRAGGTLDRATWVRAHEAQRAAIARALASGPVDVVHLHGSDFHHYLPPPGPPALVTLHLPAGAYAPEALRPARPLTFLHPVSASQRALFPPWARVLAPLGNGIDTARFGPPAPPGSFALALGRMCEEKGFHLALDAAARARVPLLLAGAVHPFPEHVRYFEERIRPRLDRAHRFVGPVAGARKRSLLAHARCVLVTSLVPETCSLVALEALASGTPVVAFRRGALPEIVEEGRTGFLVDTVDERAEALTRVGQVSRDACRRAAEARFSVRDAADRYLARYRELAALPRHAAAPAVPAPAPSPSAVPGPRQELRLERVGSLERLEAVRGAWQEPRHPRLRRRHRGGRGRGRAGARLPARARGVRVPVGRAGPADVALVHGRGAEAGRRRRTLAAGRRLSPAPRGGTTMTRSLKQLLAEANAAVETWPVDRAAGALGSPDVAFVDVREPDEVAREGTIPGAERVPRGLLEFCADPESPSHRAVFSSGKTLVLYCAGGGRSALAARTLKEMGVARVAHVAGGFKAWAAAGHPVARPGSTP